MLCAAQQSKRDHPNNSALLPHGCHYIGSLNAAGQPHGLGATFHPDGSPEVTLQNHETDAGNGGRWIDGALYGRVTQLFEDGEGYEGLFRDDLREGIGVFSWKSGERYEGQWAAGKRSGLGAEWNKDDNLSECGRWADGKLVERCAVPLRLIPEGKFLSEAGQSLLQSCCC